MAQDNLGGGTRFSIGRVLVESVRVLLRNFVPFMLLAVVIAIPSFIIEYLASRNPAAPGEMFNVSSVISGLVGLLTAALTQSALTYGTLQDLRGQRAGLADCVSRGLAATPKVAIAAILWAIAIGIGWVLLFVPGVILMVMFWVYVPAIVVENSGVTECFGRSRALTRGHRWGIFGMFLLLGVVIAGLELILFTQVEDVQAMAMAMTSGWMLWGISAVSVVITAYAAVLTSVGYYYLRAEKEGVLIEDIAKVFD
jgi:MFS family permease